MDNRQGSAIGTANMRFHQTIAELAGSEGIAAEMRRVLAVLRRVFQQVDDPDLHRRHRSANRELYGLLRRGQLARAERSLFEVLERSRREVLERFQGTDADAEVVAGRPRAGRARQ